MKGADLFVTGTGTDVGKTLVSAWLCLKLGAAYWKPVQAGTWPQTDTEWVKHVTGLPPEDFFPEKYRLQLPASPHLAAAAEGLVIDPSQIRIPSCARPLVAEGAGGLMVPLTDDVLLIDWLAQQGLPTILVVHTVLGCINHALLSMEALQHRGIPLAGIVFNEGGRADPIAIGSEAVILKKANAPLMGRIPQMDIISRESLLAIPMLAKPLTWTGI